MIWLTGGVFEVEHNDIREIPTAKRNKTVLPFVPALSQTRDQQGVIQQNKVHILLGFICSSIERCDIGCLRYYMATRGCWHKLGRAFDSLM
jgi:hypothetical protein